MATLRGREGTDRLRCKFKTGSLFAHPHRVPPVPIDVAVVMTAFHPGGTERQMIELIRRLDPARFRVHVACFHRTGAWLPRVEAAAVEIAEFPLRSFKSPHTFGVARAFMAWLRARRIIAVHACDRYANIFGLPAAALAGVPLRIASRRELAPPDQTRAHRAAMGLAYRTAHRVVANSTAAAAMLRSEGVDAKKILVIPNGIDLDAYAVVRSAAPKRTIGTVANLRNGKGHDVLLRAFQQVRATVPDARLLLVGSGHLRGALEQLAGVLGVTDGVEFLGHREDVPDVLARCDLYAFPSLSEAFPNGLIEGMAAGLPVVTTDGGGMAELVDHGRNGLVVPVSDPHAMAHGLLELMDRPAYADSLGRAARGTIEERYSFDRMVNEFSVLYSSAVAGTQAQCVA